MDCMCPLGIYVTPLDWPFPPLRTDHRGASALTPKTTVSAVPLACPLSANTRPLSTGLSLNDVGAVLERNPAPGWLQRPLHGVLFAEGGSPPRRGTRRSRSVRPHRPKRRFALAVDKHLVPDESIPESGPCAERHVDGRPCAPMVAGRDPAAGGRNSRDGAGTPIGGREAARSAWGASPGPRRARVARCCDHAAGNRCSEGNGRATRTESRRLRAVGGEPALSSRLSTGRLRGG